MIQRIQTLFMFLSAVCSGLLFFFDLASFECAGELVNFSILGLDNGFLDYNYSWPLIVLVAITTIVPVYALFRFKRRRMQIKLCQVDMLLNLLFAVLFMLYYSCDIQRNISSDMVEYKIGILLPLVCIVFNFLAIRGVKKDIELLRSVDRIR